MAVTGTGVALSGASTVSGTGISVTTQVVTMDSVETLRSSWDAFQHNYQQIADTLNNRALYLTDIVDETNQMELDLKSQGGAKITLVPSPVDDRDPIVLTNLREAMLDRVVSNREEQLGSDIVSTVSNLVDVVYTVGSGLLEVYSEGLRKYKGRDYNETSPTSVTWVIVPVGTDQIEFINREIV